MIYYPSKGLLSHHPHLTYSICFKYAEDEYGNLFPRVFYKENNKTVVYGELRESEFEGWMKL